MDSRSQARQQLQRSSPPYSQDLIDATNDIEQDHSQTKEHVRSSVGHDSDAESSSSTINVPVKVINPEKKNLKVFMFCPTPESITTPKELREELFGNKIVPHTNDFEVGYF